MMISPYTLLLHDSECSKWLNSETGEFKKKTPKKVLEKAEALLKAQQQQYEENIKRGIYA